MTITRTEVFESRLQTKDSITISYMESVEVTDAIEQLQRMFNVDVKVCPYRDLDAS